MTIAIHGPGEKGTGCLMGLWKQESLWGKAGIIRFASALVWEKSSEDKNLGVVQGLGWLSGGRDGEKGSTS